MNTLRHQILVLAISLGCIGISTTANAHYLWISVNQAAGEMKGTNIFFEESARPGDGYYLDHFLGTSDVWVRTIDQPTPPAQKADEVKVGDNRWLRVALPTSDQYSVDSYGKFGVYEYGTKKVLLHYYARNLSVESHDAMHELGRAEQMDLDFVPHERGDQIEFTLLWRGEAVADRLVFVRGSDGLRKNVTTDSRGKVELKLPKQGSLTLRSSVEFPTPGEEDGEAYEAIRHNITFVMPLGKTPQTSGP